MVVTLLYWRDKLIRKILDLPLIGWRLRNAKYERIFKSLRPGEIAIDLGANVGNVTSKMIREGVEVYAFEPNPHAFKKLKDRFINNPYVYCKESAVGDNDGRTRLYFHEKEEEDQVKYSTGSSFFESKENVDKEKYVEVEVVDIGDFVSRLDRTIGLMKIDVEGAEIAILNRLIDTGEARKARHILVETHERIPGLYEPTLALRKRIYDEGLSNIDLNYA